MKTPRMGTRNQAVLLGLLIVGLSFLLIRRGGGATAPATAPASTARVSADAAEGETQNRSRRGSSRTRQATVEDVQLLNKAHLDEAGRAAAGAEVSRNLFDFREPTPVPPPPVVPTRTIPPTFGPPPPTWTPGPTFTPVPPEIPFRFLGSFGPRDNPIATLVSGEQVVNARAGQVVFDQFIIRKVGYESLDVGYVRYPATVMKRLAITP